MVDDILHISLHVYDTELSANVPRADEEYYRKAAKRISDTVNSYTSNYSGKKTEKEILYMALLDIALRYEKNEGRNDTAPYSGVLAKLTSEIEEVINK